MSDVERVKAAMAFEIGVPSDHIPASIVKAAMRETREIDAEAAMKAGHRAVMAYARLGVWMSAALDDPAVCDAMKADIQEWFSAGEPVNECLAAVVAERLEGRADAE